LEIDEPTVAGTVPKPPMVFNFGGLTVSVVPVPAFGVPLVAKDFNVDRQADIVWENTLRASMVSGSSKMASLSPDRSSHNPYPMPHCGALGRGMEIKNLKQAPHFPQYFQQIY